MSFLFDQRAHLTLSVHRSARRKAAPLAKGRGRHVCGREVVRKKLLVDVWARVSSVRRFVYSRLVSMGLSHRTAMELRIRSRTFLCIGGLETGEDENKAERGPRASRGIGRDYVRGGRPAGRAGARQARVRSSVSRRPGFSRGGVAVFSGRSRTSNSGKRPREARLCGQS